MVIVVVIVWCRLLSELCCCLRREENASDTLRVKKKHANSITMVHFIVVAIVFSFYTVLRATLTHAISNFYYSTTNGKS